jgi:hypothetical protein
MRLSTVFFGKNNYFLRQKTKKEKNFIKTMLAKNGRIFAAFFLFNILLDEARLVPYTQK